MLDSIERGLYWLSSYFFESDADLLCQLRCPVDETTLLTAKDQLMSVVRIGGGRKLMGEHEFEKASANMAALVSKLFKSGTGKGHSLSFAFRSSPAGADRVVREIYAPMIATARRLGVSDLATFESQMRSLTDICSEESTYMVFMTHPEGLSPADRKRVQEMRVEAQEAYAKAAPGCRLDDELGQRPRMPVPSLMSRHTAALNNFIKDMNADVANKNGVGLMVDILPLGSALNLVRRHLDATGFPATWSPRLLGDGSAATPAAWKRPKSAMHLTPLRIGRQLVPSPSREIFGDAELVKRDGIFYGGLVMKVLPENGSEPFHDLVERIGREIPFSCSMELIPEGTVTRGADRAFAGIVGAMGDHNKAVKKAWVNLKEMIRQGIYVAALRISFQTWATKQEEVLQNLSFLKSSLESWGSTTVTNETGSPGKLSLAAAPGYTSRTPADYLPGPLSSLVRMLPLYRPESIWTAGQLVPHTRDGRPYPIQWGTVLQKYWGTAIFAPTGTGKSFLLNMINEGIIFSPGQENLPYVAMIDVGPSALRVVKKTKAMLPERLARQIVYHRISNDEKYSVNPFDTQLGCDEPTRLDRDAIVSVLATISSGLGDEGDKFLGSVVDEAYRMFSRKSPDQRRWQAALHPPTQELLEKIGYKFQEVTFVWEVVDALMAAGFAEEAGVAQRYAVPRMPDLVKACRSREIMQIYQTATTPGREPIIEVFTRAIQTAQSEYALVYNFTKFDVGAARAVFLDLEELVTDDNSLESRKRSALMFMFGRRLATRNFFLRWDELEGMVPPAYVDYHFNRVKDIQEQLKFLEFDEMHFANGIEAMAKRIGQDLRVGRKYKIVVIMASQLLSDFSPEIVNNCYNFFILGVGLKTSLNELIETFDLSESEANVVKNECLEPGSMLAIFKTTKGDTSQSLRTVASSINRWAFSTSKDDDLVRTEVEEHVGDYMLTLSHLARMYPSGTARVGLDMYRRSRKATTGDGSGIIAEFVREKVLPDVERYMVRETEMEEA